MCERKFAVPCLRYIPQRKPRKVARDGVSITQINAYPGHTAIRCRETRRMRAMGLATQVRIPEMTGTRWKDMLFLALALVAWILAPLALALRGSSHPDPASATAAAMTAALAERPCTGLGRRRLRSRCCR